MPEVEVKLRVDPEDARARMKALGCPPGPARTQTDVYFAHPTRDFPTTDEALRLREQGGRLELTYKGPRQAGEGAKVRVEHNVAVQQDPTPLLEGLGFTRAAVLKKRRASVGVDGCLVELDHVEGLGWFLEVECLHEDAEAARRAVDRVLARLGLLDAERVPASYLDLALEAGVVERLGAPDGGSE